MRSVAVCVFTVGPMCARTRGFVCMRACAGVQLCMQLWRNQVRVICARHARDIYVPSRNLVGSFGQLCAGYVHTARCCSYSKLSAVAAGQPILQLVVLQCIVQLEVQPGVHSTMHFMSASNTVSVDTGADSTAYCLNQLSLHACPFGMHSAPFPRASGPW